MAGATLDVTLNPIIDVTNWNKIMETLKTSLGALGTTIKPIDASQAFVGIVSSAGKAVDDVKTKFNDLPKSTNDTGTKAGNNFKNSFVSSISGLGNSLNGALAPVLSVFGGNVLTKGFSSVVGSFGDWIEKGKAVMENSNQMRMAFSLQGKSNEELNKSISETNKVAGALANKYAMTVGEVREYSKAAAVLGGASGKSNETLTQLGIAVSKATNGMVDGTMAIRLFSKGVADPESQFALGRLTKQFPALGAAMKDLKDPAEATEAAMKFFAPAMKELQNQADGPIGSFTKLQNNLNAVKTAFGSVIIEAIAPFAQSFSQTIVPALQSFTGFIKGLAGFISPLAPLFTVVGTALGGLVVSLLALKGVSYFGTLAQQGMQFGLTILQKVVPSLVAQNAAQTALVLNTEALTLANVKNQAIKLKDLAIDKLSVATDWLKITAKNAYNAVLGSGLATQNALSFSNMKEAATNALSTASTWLKTTATSALTAAKGGLLAIGNALTLSNLKEVASNALSAAASMAKAAAIGLASLAMGAYTVVTNLASLATLKLVAAMLLNPYTLIAAGIITLVVIVYKLISSIGGLAGVWEIMKTAASAAWNIIKNLGSALVEIGKLLLSVVVIPFKVFWSVITGFANSIMDLLGLNNKASDSFTKLQKILNWLADAFHYVMLGIEAFKAVIEGVIAYIGSMVDSVGTGIKQLFSLDFGGLWDTITGAGDKAANAFSEKFNEKMRAANFDEAKSAMKENLSSGLDIQAKINVETNNKQLVTEYEETSKKISDLLSIKSSQGLTKEQQADLDALQKKASETGAKIAQIAPEAVNSFKGITDANGKITDSYDINIDKAKEFANANNFSGVFEEQKNRVSQNLTDMAQTYGSQVQQMETYRQQLQQPIENEEEYAKLKDKFTETKKKAEEMKNALLDSFGQAGEAGLLTDGSIKEVAKSLKVTEQQAREMLLAKELKKVADSGVYTEKQIEAIANKYGVTKEKAIELLNASKGQTKEVEKTEQKVKDLAEAWGKVKSAIDAASSKSTADYTAAKLYSQYLKSNPELAKKMYETQDENGKAMFDRLKQMSDDERANYINNLLEKGKADEKIKKTVTADAKKAEQDITGEKEKQSKSDKQSTAEKQSQYEIAKALLDTETKSKLADLDKEESKKRQFNYENDIVLTEKAKNLEQLKSIENQKTIYESQLKQAEINSKLAKTDKERADATNVINEINKSLDKLKENSSEIEYKIRFNDSEALKQLPSALRNLQTEADKYGGVAVKASVDITQQTIDNLNTQITDLEKEIPTIQAKIETANANKDNDDYLKQAEALNKIYEQINKNREQIGTLQIEKEFGLQYNNLLKIDNLKERSHQKELIDLDKKYKEDLLKAQGNEYQKAELTNKFLADKYALEQKYIEETQTIFQKSLNPSALLADWKSAFDGVSFFSDVNADNTALTDITKQQDDLKNSYKDGSVAYASYIDQMNDLDKKRTEEVKKQSNAQSRILRAFSESIAKYTQIQISKYEEERNKYVSEQQKRYDAKAKLESDLASIDDKNSAKAIALKSQIAQNELDINNARIDADTNLYNQMGYNLMNYVAQGKSAFKSLVLSSLDMLYGKFMMAIPDIFIQSISWLGPIAGPITAGALTATLTGLYAAAKQGVGKLKFWKGGLIPGGQQDITVNELGQEFVVNHKALMQGNNLKDLIAINRDNISIEEYAKRNYASYRTEQNAYNNYLDNKILKQGFAELKQEIRNVAVQTRRNVGLEVKLDTDKMIEATILKHNQKVGRF